MLRIQKWYALLYKIFDTTAKWFPGLVHPWFRITAVPYVQVPELWCVL